MKIAVVGCGALGGFYGAKLAHAGRETHFLFRSDYETVRSRGLRIVSPGGDFYLQPKCTRTPEEIGVSDLVIIGLKTTANDCFAELLPPLVSSHTIILTLQNGLGNEDRLAALFEERQIMGGLCFVCLNRVKPGVIHHLAHGKIILGEYKREPEARTHEIASMFEDAGIPCKVTDDLERAHWEKLVWNIPFNGLGVAGASGFEAVISGERENAADPGSCLSTDLLLDNGQWESLVRELMEEIIRIASAYGHEFKSTLIDDMISRTRVMGAYRASTLVDFEQNRPLELESMFLEPLRRARKKNVPAPRLTALCSILAQLNNPPSSGIP